MSPASGLHIGFHRRRQPDPPPVVISIGENVEAAIARLVNEADPFNVVDRCSVNETGHDPQASCGEIVCVHCGKVFWR